MSEQIRYLIESYYDIQKLRIGTFNRIVAYVKSNPEKFSHIKFETRESDASQAVSEPRFKDASRYVSGLRYKNAFKPSDIARLIVSGDIETPSEVETLVWYHNALLETEKSLAKKLDAWSRDHPLRVQFLSRVQGIGGVLSSGIIAWLSPISRFPNISKLWKYCGLAPGQRRRRGEKINYNPKLKSFMWKVATSFEKQKPEKSYYRRIYDEKKKYYTEREDLRRAVESGEKGALLHIRLMTLRYTVKRFLADLWVQWRLLEGLPITKPYAHQVLGHQEYQEWKPDK
jgi:hypothetical protein